MAPTKIQNNLVSTAHQKLLKERKTRLPEYQVRTFRSWTGEV